MPYRVVQKMKRELRKLTGNPFIQRNFELQFLGHENDMKLRQCLFDSSFLQFIPEAIVTEIYSNFKSDDYVGYSHPTSMLLTLALWYKHFSNR